MKKHLIIVGIICAVIISPAYVVTKCVKLTSSTTCSNLLYSGSNWSATCDGIPIQGVTFCGSQNGDSIGATSTTVTTSYTSDDNKYCWCKMVSPAVSRWAFVSEYPHAGACADDCAYYCSNRAVNDASFRAALFGSLSD